MPHATRINLWMCTEGAQIELQRERCVPKVLKLSSEVSESKPLPCTTHSPHTVPTERSRTARQMHSCVAVNRAPRVAGMCATRSAPNAMRKASDCVAVDGARASDGEAEAKIFRK